LKSSIDRRAQRFFRLELVCRRSLACSADGRPFVKFVSARAGVVSFASRPDQNTSVNLKLTSSFGSAVSHRVDQSFHNFKRLVEAG
jgi:hypothetical protein